MHVLLHAFVPGWRSWRSIKLLGSLLGSAEDVDMRISKESKAFCSISWRRHSFQSRLCIFNCLIMTILLYKCGLWTLSKLLNDKRDKWQRRKLRVLLQIVYPQRITNNNLCPETKQSPVSGTCRRSRLLWFGYVVREGPESASFQALELSINTNDIKNPWPSAIAVDRYDSARPEGSGSLPGERSPSWRR